MERIALSFAVVCTLTAQAGFRTEGRLVLINASVFDGQNRFHGELRRENFQLSEDGVAARLESVAVEEVPLSTVILLDISRSMAKGIAQEREALGRFLDKARPGDEFCVVAFNAEVPDGCVFTRDPEKVRARAADMVAGGGTALCDALLAGLALTKRARNPRRAVLLFSDGAENSSGARWKAVRRAALETDAALYVVSLPDWQDVEGWQALRLKELAEETGGRLLAAHSVKDLPAVLEQMDVRLQYVLAFIPRASLEDPARHTVRVRLHGEAARHLRIYWRHSYSAMVH